MIPGPLIELVYEMTKDSALDIFYFVIIIIFWKTELSIDQFILLYIVRVINWANQNLGSSIVVITTNRIRRHQVLLAITVN